MDNTCKFWHNQLAIFVRNSAIVSLAFAIFYYFQHLVPTLLVQISFFIWILCILYTFISTPFRRGKAVFNDMTVTIYANRKVYEVEYTDVTKTEFGEGRYPCYIIRRENNRNIKIGRMGDRGFEVFDAMLTKHVNNAKGKRRKGKRKSAPQ